MKVFLFMIVSFFIVITLLYVLPLRIRKSGAALIALLAFLTAGIGIIANQFYSLSVTILFLSLLSVTVSYFLVTFSNQLFVMDQGEVGVEQTNTREDIEAKTVTNVQKLAETESVELKFFKEAEEDNLNDESIIGKTVKEAKSDSTEEVKIKNKDETIRFNKSNDIDEDVELLLKRGNDEWNESQIISEEKPIVTTVDTDDDLELLTNRTELFNEAGLDEVEDTVIDEGTRDKSEEEQTNTNGIEYGKNEYIHDDELEVIPKETLTEFISKNRKKQKTFSEKQKHEIDGIEELERD